MRIISVDWTIRVKQARWDKSCAPTTTRHVDLESRHGVAWDAVWDGRRAGLVIRSLNNLRVARYRIGFVLPTSLKTVMAETTVLSVAMKIIEFLETRDRNEKTPHNISLAHWLNLASVGRLPYISRLFGTRWRVWCSTSSIWKMCLRRAGVLAGRHLLVGRHRRRQRDDLSVYVFLTLNTFENTCRNIFG